MSGAEQDVAADPSAAGAERDPAALLRRGFRCLPDILNDGDRHQAHLQDDDDHMFQISDITTGNVTEPARKWYDPQPPAAAAAAVDGAAAPCINAIKTLTATLKLPPRQITRKSLPKRKRQKQKSTSNEKGARDVDAEKLVDIDGLDSNDRNPRRNEAAGDTQNPSSSSEMSNQTNDTPVQNEMEQQSPATASAAGHSHDDQQVMQGSAMVASPRGDFEPVALESEQARETAAVRGNYFAFEQKFARAKLDAKGRTLSKKALSRADRKLQQYQSNGKRKRKRDDRSIENGAEMLCDWIQCDNCNKWRRLPMANNHIPAKWYCTMNEGDRAHARCSAPEEPEDSDEEERHMGHRALADDRPRRLTSRRTRNDRTETASLVGQQRLTDASAEKRRLRRLRSHDGFCHRPASPRVDISTSSNVEQVANARSTRSQSHAQSGDHLQLIGKATLLPLSPTIRKYNKANMNLEGTEDSTQHESSRPPATDDNGTPPVAGVVDGRNHRRAGSTSRLSFAEIGEEEQGTRQMTSIDGGAAKNQSNAANVSKEIAGLCASRGSTPFSHSDGEATALEIVCQPTRVSHQKGHENAQSCLIANENAISGTSEVPEIPIGAEDEAASTRKQNTPNHNEDMGAQKGLYLAVDLSDENSWTEAFNRLDLFKVFERNDTQGRSRSARSRQDARLSVKGNNAKDSCMVGDDAAKPRFRPRRQADAARRSSGFSTNVVKSFAKLRRKRNDRSIEVQEQSPGNREIESHSSETNRKQIVTASRCQPGIHSLYATKDSHSPDNGILDIGGAASIVALIGTEDLAAGTLASKGRQNETLSSGSANMSLPLTSGLPESRLGVVVTEDQGRDTTEPPRLSMFPTNECSPTVPDMSELDCSHAEGHVESAAANASGAAQCPRECASPSRSISVDQARSLPGSTGKGPKRYHLTLDLTDLDVPTIRNKRQKRPPSRSHDTSLAAKQNVSTYDRMTNGAHGITSCLHDAANSHASADSTAMSTPEIISPPLDEATSSDTEAVDRRVACKEAAVDSLPPINNEEQTVQAAGTLTALSVIDSPPDIRDECHVYWKPFLVAYHRSPELADSVPVVIWDRRPLIRSKPRASVDGLPADEIEYYIHFNKSDYRLDCWITLDGFDISKLNRKSLTQRRGDDTNEKIFVKKIEKVVIGGWEIPAWYESSFPQKYECGILHFCRYCLAHTDKETVFRRHEWTCKSRCPPGRVIYREDDIKVYEVDGRIETSFCQRLCQLSKLFLDHKSICYDVKRFNFYILTTSDIDGAHFAGFFSKERMSAEGYNLACIMTLPQFQKEGYGKFLISLSYEMTKRETICSGSPEKPFSPLGFLVYKSYWKHILLSAYSSSHKRSGLMLSELSLATGMTFKDIETAVCLIGGNISSNGRVQIGSDVIESFLLSNHQVRLVRPECLDWQEFDESVAGAITGHSERERHGYDQLDDGTICGCDGMTYATSSTSRSSIAAQPRKFKANEPGTHDESRAIFDGPENNDPSWLILGGTDIPEFEDDDDYSFAASEADDEETIRFEESLPPDICRSEELLLLHFLGNMQLDELCTSMNLPIRQPGATETADKTPDEAFHEPAVAVQPLVVASPVPNEPQMDADHASPEPSYPISKLTVRFGAVVLEAIMQNSHFDEVQEHWNASKVTFDCPELKPTSASEKMHLLLRRFNQEVQQGLCEDALRYVIRNSTISSIQEGTAAMVDLFKRRIRQSDDCAFLSEFKYSKAKDTACRSITRFNESVERDPQQVLEEHRVEKATLDEPFIFQPRVRRIPAVPFVAEDDLSFDVWRTRHTYCELTRLNAALLYHCKDEESYRESERRKHTFIFVKERLPRLTDDPPHFDRSRALELLTANKEHVIQCIGEKAWDEIFPKNKAS